MNYKIAPKRDRSVLRLILALFTVAVAAFLIGDVAQSHAAASPHAGLTSLDPINFIGFGLAGLVTNRGKAIKYLSGINGVAANSTALVNLNCNARYHSIILNVTDGGSAVDVTTEITAATLKVNGVSIRDIPPTDIIRMANSNGYFPLLGELPFFFSEPFPTGGLYNEPSDINAWDMFGQNSFSLELAIAGTTPAITGTVEYDGQRNRDKDGNLFLQAVNHHRFVVSVPGGQFDITNLPIPFPVRRMWLKLSTGTLTSMAVIQDGQVVHEGLALDIRKQYRKYGFKFAQTDATPFVNATGPAALGISTAIQTPAYYDGAFIGDADGRPWKALQVEESMILRVVTSTAANLTVIMETIPGSFRS